MRHGLEQCPRILLQPVRFLQWNSPFRYPLTARGVLPIWRTCNSLMETQELDGKPCNIGTKNCKQPLQWPIRSIMQIKLKILMKTEAILRNCNQRGQSKGVHFNQSPTPLVYVCVCLHVCEWACLCVCFWWLVCVRVFFMHVLHMCM